ncbi:cyclic nucleotide-binding domain-containing protein [Enhygromyxa salina]|uniref:cyclic nucleotide-binding domain-containing protein n=1 Tax=Enhygromyxa salina TaxID=215803 RepID=UPI0015E679BF|nr:cyclic nucleotide-binding domain-containing protein [Enhygromyxa salina]
MGDTSGDISSYWPFDALPKAAGKLLSEAALELELDHDTWLFHQDDPADALFVLVSGQLDVYQGDPPMWRKRLAPGACVGELPLVVGGERVRSGSIRAVGSCRLIGLGYSDVRRLLTRRVFDALLTPVTERHLARLELGLATLFGTLPLSMLVEIDGAMIQRHLQAGEVLFNPNETLRHVWLVDEGRLEVLVERDGQLQRVAEIGPGQPVGELAVLIGGERSAMVRAVRDTWLRGLTAPTFEALLMRHPGAALGLARTLARRLVQANQQPVVVNHPRTLALVPAQPGVDLRGFAGALVEQLSSDVAVLGAQQFAADAPGAVSLDDDPALRRFGEWLSAAEAEHDAVLLLVAGQLDAWTRACVSAADEVVLIADSGDVPPPTEVERAMLTGESPGELVQLVLCHPPGTPTPGDESVLMPWLEARSQLVFLHEVAKGDRRDFSRLGRGLFRS